MPDRDFRAGLWEVGHDAERTIYGLQTVALFSSGFKA